MTNIELIRRLADVRKSEMIINWDNHTESEIAQLESLGNLATKKIPMLEKLYCDMTEDTFDEDGKDQYRHTVWIENELIAAYQYQHVWQTIKAINEVTK